MKFELLKEERCINLLSLIELFNAAIEDAKEPGGGELLDIFNKKSGERETGIQFAGTEAKQKLKEYLFDKDNEVGNLFYWDDQANGAGGWKINDGLFLGGERLVSKKIRMPYTKEEILYMQYLSQSGIFRLLLEDEEHEKLDNNIAAYLKQNEISVDEYKTISEFVVMKGSSKEADCLEGDNLNRLRQNLAILRQAIQNKKPVTGRYELGSAAEITLSPMKLVYSQLERRLRVHCNVTKGPKELLGERRLYVSQLSMLAEREDVYEPLEAEMTGLFLHVMGERNAIVRVLARIGEYKFHSRCEKETGDYYILLIYPRMDRSRVVTRLLSFGRSISIITTKSQSAVKYLISNHCEKKEQADTFFAEGITVKHILKERVEAALAQYE